MEGYKSFIQVMDDASDHCSQWRSLEDGEHFTYEEMMKAAALTDGLMPLPDHQWWMALDDGTIALCDEKSKEIWVMYAPVKSAPVKVKYTGEEFEEELKALGLINKEEAEDAPAFCIHCGTKLPEGAAFCPKCGKEIRRG